MLGEDVLYLSVAELADKIRSRAISPVELAESYLERSRRLGPAFNAYATLTPELAMKQARAAEAEINAGKYRGPLHGIPYAAKDLLAVSGYPTQWGARPFVQQRLDFDATVIQKLTNAGAVLIGKAAMIELAGGMGYRFASASITGAAKNPWSTGCWTCGSSSGSGAIVAAALAGFAIGTETWGSIICPSSYCGISGLRPTFGRVSRWGAMALSYSMDKIGPMARAAQDCGLILAAIAGHDDKDKGSLPAGEAQFSALATAPARQLRIGRMVNQWKDLPNDIAQNTEAALQVMGKQDATVEDVTLPEGPYEPAAGTIISVEGASAFGDLIESGRIGELNDPLGRLGGYVSTAIPGTDFLRAMRIRAIYQQKVDALFDRFDVLTAASLPIGASSLETNLETELSFSDPIGGLGNLCGLPAISVPSGFTQNKLPTGMQFVGRVLDDAKVLQAAHLFQSATDWHKRRPTIS